MSIKCCNGCVPPKRNPYCHATCEDYIREKEIHEAELAADYERRRIKNGLIEQQERAIRKAAKGKKKKGEKHER